MTIKLNSYCELYEREIELIVNNLSDKGKIDFVSKYFQNSAA